MPGISKSEMILPDAAGPADPGIAGLPAPASLRGARTATNAVVSNMLHLIA